MLVSHWALLSARANAAKQICGSGGGGERRKYGAEGSRRDGGGEVARWQCAVTQGARERTGGGMGEGVVREIGIRDRGSGARALE